METSYKEMLEDKFPQFTDDVIGTVVKSTITLLRRHNIDGALCTQCGSDDPEVLRVKEVALCSILSFTSISKSMASNFMGEQAKAFRGGYPVWGRETNMHVDLVIRICE